MKNHIFYKQIISNVDFDFNSLVWQFEVEALKTRVVRESFLIKTEQSEFAMIDEIKNSLMKACEHKLTNCDVYCSLMSYIAGTPFHKDREPVLILNTFGTMCYNIYYEHGLEKVVLEKGDAIYIPSMLGHVAIPLSPRISLSFECTE